MVLTSGGLTVMTFMSAAMSLMLGLWGLTALLTGALVPPLPDVPNSLKSVNGTALSPPLMPPPPSPPKPCVDDSTWSVDSRGIYTCAWLLEHDPGCKLNACGSLDDYGQCSACPKTCDSCSALRSGSSLIPRETQVLSITVHNGKERLSIDGLDGIAEDDVDERQAGLVDDSPVVLATTPFLLASGILSGTAAVLDVRGEPGHQKLAARFLVGSALSYVGLLLAGVITYVPLHPGMCTVYWRRVVPLTPQTAHLGEVVSFYPRGQGGNHMYAVLVKARFVDIFTESCMLLSLGLPILAMLVLTNAVYWRRISIRLRSINRVHRIVDRMINTMLVAPYREMKAPPPQADATGRAGGQGGSDNVANDESDPTQPTGAPSTSAGERHAFVGGAECAECPICMEEYERDDEVVLLNCRHVLHKECLLSWARACTRPHATDGISMATCPLCKANLMPEGTQLDDDDDCCNHACLGIRGRGVDGSSTMV